MTETMTKFRLLDAMQTGHHLFKALIAGLNDEQMRLPGVIGVWSVKDIVAHIVIHEQRMIDWVTKKLHEKNVETPQPYSMPEEALILLNEQIYQQNRDRPLEDLLLELDTTYLQSFALVESASESTLFDAHRFSLQDGEPLWEAVAANTFWHYEEHGRDIRAWLSS